MAAPKILSEAANGAPVQAPTTYVSNVGSKPEYTLDDNIKDFIGNYGSVTPNNQTGKPYQDWTLIDIRKLPNSTLEQIRNIAAEDDRAKLESITPRSMTGPEFHRAVLAEAARRGEVSSRYDIEVRYNQAVSQFVRKSIAPAESGKLPVSVTGEEKPITIKPTDVAVWDASVAVLVEQLNVFGYKPDVARALGIKDPNYGKPALRGRKVPTDVEAYDLGYTAGAIPAFDPKNSPAGPSISIFVPGAPQEIQSTYCRAVNEIYQSGRAIANSDSFRTGFFQARRDALKDFNLPHVHMGLFDTITPCSTPPGAATSEQQIQVQNKT